MKKYSLKNIVKKMNKMIKERTFFIFFSKKLRKMFFIRNKIVKNMQIEDEIYRKLKRKYKYVLEKFKAKNESFASNKVWICWFQGLENAPKIVQSCVNSIKKQLSDREIIIITNDN